MKQHTISCILSLLLLCLCACAAKSTGTATATVTGETAVTELGDFTVAAAGTVFGGTVQESALGEELIIDSCVGNDQIVVLTYFPLTIQTDTEEDSAAYGVYLTILDRETLAQTSMTLDQTVWFGDASVQLLRMDMDDQGVLWLLFYEVTAQGNGQSSGEYYLTQLDLLSGEALSVVPMGELSTGEDISDFRLLSDRSVCVAFASGDIYLYDVETDETAHIASGLFSPVLHKSEDNGWFISYEADGSLFAATFDPDEKKVGPAKALGRSDWAQFADGVLGFDFFVTSGSDIYGVRVSAKTVTLVFDGLANGVNLDHVDFFSIGETLLLCDNQTEDFLHNRYVLYQYPLQEDGVDDRTVLTLYTLGITTDLQDAVAEFNQSNAAYRIEVTDFDQYADGASKLKIELMSGNIPDILNLYGLRGTAIDSEAYLLDLTDYLARDGLLSELQASVVDALTSEGRLLYLCPNYTLEILYTLDGAVKGDSLTISDFYRMAGTNTAFMSNTSVLYLLLQNGVYDIIDMQSQTVDTDQLAQMLAFASRFPAQVEASSETVMEQLYAGQRTFVQTELSSLRSFRTLLYTLGEDIQIWGYPSSSGDAVGLYANNYLAISCASAHPDTAWAFISSMLELEFQKKYSHRTFPLLTSALDAQIAEAKETDAGFSEKAEQLLSETLKKIGPITTEDETITEIILEEAQSCFSGDKSVDAVTAMIQDRLQLYLWENGS